jgi:DNA-directed RNA polymerase subunit RPC12/RpoP
VDEKKSISIQCEICGYPLASISPINGYVYILSNPCMPNLVKIGFTTRNIYERISELNSSSGVPEPFVIEATFCSINPKKDEQIIHAELNKNRTNKNREFFQFEPLDAISKVVKILEKQPDYIGVNTRVKGERLCQRKKEEERYFETKRKHILSQGIFAEDPGNSIAMYSFKCIECKNRFYSKYPKHTQTACPFCFSHEIE